MTPGFFEFLLLALNSTLLLGLVPATAQSATLVAPLRSYFLSLRTSNGRALHKKGHASRVKTEAAGTTKQISWRLSSPLHSASLMPHLFFGLYGIDKNDFKNTLCTTWG